MFNIGHCPFKVKVTVLPKFFSLYHNTKLSSPVSQLWHLVGSCDKVYICSPDNNMQNYIVTLNCYGL